MTDNHKMAYDRNAGRVQSSVASRVRNTAERLRRLRENPVPRPRDPLRFRGEFTAATGVEFRLGELTLRPRERLLIHGPNGAGKSTLLDAIHATAPARIGYLRQHERFDPAVRGHRHLRIRARSPARDRAVRPRSARPRGRYPLGRPAAQARAGPCARR
ncbi:ATP-binding cassette domain-containing protein [Nocardia fluminea]|uniref:ATP-binding cassette domain-containing protein n=1 Tax=Nocardia fluminea TaxID=134984 RepID=UPI0033D4421D